MRRMLNVYVALHRAVGGSEFQVLCGSSFLYTARQWAIYWIWALGSIGVSVGYATFLVCIQLGICSLGLATLQKAAVP